MKITPRLACLILLLGPAHAWPLEITGRILSETLDPLTPSMVTINGEAVAADAQGVFRATVEPSDFYTLHFSAEDHYDMVHSFSPLDMERFSVSSAEPIALLPDVTLVGRAEGRILLAFGGDAMMGRRFSDPYPGEPVMIREDHKAEDAIALLRHMKPYMQLADYASVNLETQVIESQPEGSAPKSYTFFSPPEILLAVREAGIDYVTLGNNHTNDYLEPGLLATLEALNASGLGWSGAGLNENDSLRAHQADIGGQPLSFLGFVGWAGNFSPNQVAQGADKGGAAFGTNENIQLTVGREAAQGRLPVIQYHGSREYTDEPTLVTETRLKQAIDQGAVLAIAHHPHVVQGFEIYKGRLIAYSMGNFIFDQFHYATQYSYIVYVWMDGDRLHRAEVVPIHIQGFTPMPATDSVRDKVLKRTDELSSRRGITMTASGGHGVILNDGSEEPQAGASLQIERDPGEGRMVKSLSSVPWSDPIVSLAGEPDTRTRYRLGENMLPTGHLENHFLHGSADRSWLEDGGQKVVLYEDAPSGRYVMQLDIPAGTEQGRVGMRTFEYTFEPGTPSTFLVTARVSRPVTVTAYQQWRKRDENRLEALENARLRTISQVELQAGEWQQLRFDFDSPRVTAISYRVVLHVTPQDAQQSTTAWFDDLALIEWLTPPLDAGPVPQHLEVEQASHVDLIPH
jgi:poly-gamma-glutamate capsule biosynthesis protein CapA/YwtB (metallophosphatase superfamily)